MPSITRMSLYFFHLPTTHIYNAHAPPSKIKDGRKKRGYGN